MHELSPVIKFGIFRLLSLLKFGILGLIIDLRCLHTQSNVTGTRNYYIYCNIYSIIELRSSGYMSWNLDGL